MRLQVKKWGNSASVRIPAAILAAAELSIDQEVDVREDNGRIIIEPVLSPRYSLDALLAAMTDDVLHDDVDFGPAIGQEIW